MNKDQEQKLRKLIKEEIDSILSENENIKDKLWDILEDAYDNATKMSSNWSGDYTDKGTLIKFAIPKILELFNKENLSESQKNQTQNEMNDLLEKAKKESKRIKELMKKKGYNV